MRAKSQTSSSPVLTDPTMIEFALQCQNRGKAPGTRISDPLARATAGTAAKFPGVTEL
jgi:hypothetical protein